MDDIFQEDKIISGIRYKQLSTHRVINNETIRYFIAIGDNQIRRRIEKRLNLSDMVRLSGLLRKIKKILSIFFELKLGDLFTSINIKQKNYYFIYVF